MATTQEAIRRLSIQATTSGVKSTTQELGALAGAHQGVAVASASTERATLSLESRFASIERRYVAQVRAQQDYERVQRQVNDAVAQNPALQERANAVLAAAAAKFNLLTGAANDNAAAMARQAAESQRAASVQARVNGITGVTGSSDGAARSSDIAAYGRALDDLRAKYNPLFAAGQQYKATLIEINQAARVGAISEVERATAINATKAAFVNQVAAIRAAGNAYTAAARGAGSMSGSLTQLSFQINDIASGLVMGQSPFMILAQQGGQVFQIWQLNNNVFKELGTLIATLAARAAAFLGPLGLIGVGFTVVAAAAGAFYAMTREKAKTAEEVLKDHADAISAIKTAYGDAANAAGKFYDQSKAITTLQTQQNLIALQNQLRIASSQSIRSMSTPVVTPDQIPLGVPSSAVVSDVVAGTTSYRALNDEIERFNASARNASDIQSFRDAVAAIGIAAQSTTPELAKQANEILTNTKGLGELSLAMVKTEASLRLLNGTASKSDREMLGLSTHAQVNSYDQLIQRTRDRIAELKLEAQTTGQTAGAVQALRLQHDAERAAKQAGVKVNQTVVDQLKEELVATMRLNEAAKVRADIDFGRKTSLLAPEDAQIAQQLKGLYPEVATALDSVEAAALRTNMALSGIGSSIAGPLTSGLADIVDHTKSAGQGFADLQKTVIRAIEEMIIKITIIIPLMRALQAAAGMFGGFLGGGAAAGSSAAQLAAGVIPMHTGGIVGAETGGAPRVINPAAFYNAPRHHTGIGPGERAAILQDTEGVFTAGQMRALGMKVNQPAPAINVIIQGAPSQPKVTSKQNSNGSRDIYIDFRDMVRGVMTDDVQSDGPISQALAGKVKGFGQAA